MNTASDRHMDILKIHTFPDNFLKKTAKPVENIDGTLQRVIDQMGQTMYEAPGVGLASIQVGVEQSILVYDIGPRDEKRELHVLMNPRIISSEGETLSEDEGCLSVPDYRADVKRAESILVEGDCLFTTYSLFIFTSALVAYSCFERTRRAISPQSSSIT